MAGEVGNTPLPDSTTANALAERFGLEFREIIEARDLDPAIVGRLPIQYARRSACLALRATPDGAVEVALADPRCAEIVDDLRALFRCPIVPVVVPGAALLEGINRAYDDAQGSAQSVMGDLEGGGLDEVAHELEEPRDLLDADDEAPILSLIHI